jgi:hypothetical protein
VQATATAGQQRIPGAFRSEKSCFMLGNEGFLLLLVGQRPVENKLRDCRVDVGTLVGGRGRQGGCRRCVRVH